MALVMGSLYEALRTAGSGDACARRGAEEMASAENRIAKVDGDLNLAKWMVGFNLAITAAVPAKLLI